MKIYQLFALAAVVVQVVGASKPTSKSSQLNGWYPCTDYTLSDSGGSGGQNAECATYAAPLCYPGICETPQFADPTIDIFVKRMLATTGDPKTASNIWLLRGGPGDGSTGLEASMVSLHTEMEGAANAYTMDHRGTGRSTFLDCVAAQAMTTGSPDGNIIKPYEVPACAQALENEYGDLASFSTISAANDLVTFISKFTNGASTIVYGTSYGTVLVERVMHLDPPEVTEYVLDGIATTSGAPAGKFEYLSEWDAYFGEVGDYFMDLSATHPGCNSHFKKPNTLRKTLQSVLSDLDKHPNSTCATIINSIPIQFPNATPSTKLRTTLGMMLMDAEQRKLIPPIVYRLNRCEKNDADILTQFANLFGSPMTASSEENAYYSMLLYCLIVFSEMWETPQPSTAVMEKRFTSHGISSGTYWMLPLYCAF